MSLVGLAGFEPATSRLSGGRSNQLSYRPNLDETGAGLFGPAPVIRWVTLKLL